MGQGPLEVTKQNKADIFHELMLFGTLRWVSINTLRPIQDIRHFADDILTCIFFNENCCILIKFSLKFVRNGPIDKNPALVQIMAWRRSGDKPLSEPMMISLPTHICVTRPQWVNPSSVYRPYQCDWWLLSSGTVSGWFITIDHRQR